MDFRSEIEEILEENGIYVLYRRKSKKIKCTCFNELHKSADPDCPVCEGTGRMVSFERIKVVVNPNNAGASSSSVQMTELGSAYSPKFIVVGNEQAHLTAGDIIYLVGWKGNYPVTINKVLEITFAEPMRQENGRAEYSLGYAKVNPEEIKRAQKVLKKITGKEVEVRS